MQARGGMKKNDSVEHRQQEPIPVETKMIKHGARGSGSRSPQFGSKRRNGSQRRKGFRRGYPTAVELFSRRFRDCALGNARQDRREWRCPQCDVVGKLFFAQCDVSSSSKSKALRRPGFLSAAIAGFPHTFSFSPPKPIFLPASTLLPFHVHPPTHYL